MLNKYKTLGLIPSNLREVDEGENGDEEDEGGEKGDEEDMCMGRREIRRTNTEIRRIGMGRVGGEMIGMGG